MWIPNNTPYTYYEDLINDDLIHNGGKIETFKDYELYKKYFKKYYRSQTIDKNSSKYQSFLNALMFYFDGLDFRSRNNVKTEYDPVELKRCLNRIRTFKTDDNDFVFYERFGESKQFLGWDWFEFFKIHYSVKKQTIKIDYLDEGFKDKNKYIYRILYFIEYSLKEELKNVIQEHEDKEFEEFCKNYQNTK